MQHSLQHAQTAPGAARCGGRQLPAAGRPCVARPHKALARPACAAVAAPPPASGSAVLEPRAPAQARPGLPELITTEKIRALEAELDSGASVAALRRFNDNLRSLDVSNWEAKLRPVMWELAYNLESFNPAFTSVLLKVQATIGFSDYERRDAALKNLIQPLAGEYGMHNGEPQAKTHRELFSEFYADLLRQPLEAALAAGPRPPLSVALWQQMQRDLAACGGSADPIEQASYALGYNLAIEYLADYEKTWMLDSFRALNAAVLEPAGRPLSQWLFLEVHAEGEAEHAAIGHAAAAAFVPAAHLPALRRAFADHDRDFAAFYGRLADMLA